jgi:hypothetical protein
LRLQVVKEDKEKEDLRADSTKNFQVLGVLIATFLFLFLVPIDDLCSETKKTKGYRLLEYMCRYFEEE